MDVLTQEVFIVDNQVCDTLDKALQVANFMHETNGVIAGIEKIIPRKPQFNRMYSVSKYIAQHGIAQYLYVCHCYQVAYWHGETDSLFKVIRKK